MSIIYEQTPGGLYPTGQRTVTTFPSGLIRVDQSFACKTSVAPTHRATLAVGSNFPGESYPAMDGLKIFPEPQEKRRDDGFTEFTVSGYGRLNSDGVSLSSFDYSVPEERRKTVTKHYVYQTELGDPLIQFPTFPPVKEYSKIITETPGNLLYQYWDPWRRMTGTRTLTITPSTYYLKFLGSGTIILSGAINATVVGSNSNFTEYQFTTEDLGGLQIQTTGTILIPSLTNTSPNDTYMAWIESQSSIWLIKSVQSNNYGSFSEVSVLFHSA